jgi:ferric iron reductase protein FhuF
VSMVTPVRNYIMAMTLVLLQSIASQYYDKCTMIVIEVLFQLIRQKSSHQHTNNMHIEKSGKNNADVFYHHLSIYDILSK